MQASSNLHYVCGRQKLVARSLFYGLHRSICICRDDKKLASAVSLFKLSAEREATGLAQAVAKNRPLGSNPVFLRCAVAEQVQQLNPAVVGKAQAQVEIAVPNPVFRRCTVGNRCSS